MSGTGAGTSRKLFFLLFAFSGFSGLIYESVWTHYLKLFLGHAAYAQSLVLAIFMGGLAAGSYISSRLSPGWKDLLRAYAITEAAIGVFAIGFHEVFSGAVSVSYLSVIPNLGHPAAIEIYKWTLSSLLILPQTVFLGMTFPLMTAGVLRVFPDNPGRSISLLYFANSIGAVLGVLVSGFLLIRLAGLPWTIRTAGVINILVALSVLVIIKNAPAPVPAAEASGTGVLFDKRRLTPLLAIAFGTGMASFIYEMGWIRMLSLVLGSSTHSFELMLSAFIFGLALGGLWIQRRIDSLPNSLRYLAVVQVVMGVSAVVTLAVYGNLFEVMQWLMARLARTGTGYLMFNLSSHAISLAIMLPATFCAGMTLPLITYILIRRGYGEKSIGAVYAANTFGAIAGVFFAMHVGMPHLGLKWLLICGAAIDIGIGLVLAWGVSSGFSINARTALSMAGIATLAIIAIFVGLDPVKMSSGVYRGGRIYDPNDFKVIYQKDGKTATVSLTLQGGILSICTNGKSDAGIMVGSVEMPSEDESTMVLLGALPLWIRPEARTAANIGFGSGLTTHSLLGSPLIQRVDTIEIEAAMVEAANRFRPMVERAYTDRRSHIYIDDAKTFFSTHGTKYDIIVSEPSNPWVSGVSGLFSGEFYGYVTRYLNERGLFVQWVQLYEINIDLVASIFKALSGHFHDYVVYAANNNDLIIIASKDGPVGRPGESIFHYSGLDSLLRRIGVLSLQDVEIRRIGGKKVLDPYFKSYPTPANSDYYPVLDQNAARERFLGASSTGFMKYSHEPLPAMEMLDGWEPSHRSTAVYNDPYFVKSQWSNTAMSFRDYFISGQSGAGGLGPGSMHDAAMMKHLFSGCSYPESAETREQGAFNVAVQMLPYLTASELERVWSALGTGSCRAGRTHRDSEWISLFRAVGKRDAAGMAGHSVELLKTDTQLTDVEVKYLVAAGMLGSIAAGDKGLCRDLWNAYGAAITGSGDPPVIFPVLAAHCPPGH